MTNPYQNQPRHQFHKYAVAGLHPSDFDPVIETKFKFDKTQSVATMGSCFAQNLSKWLVDHKYNFVSTEPSDSNAGGLFSANFGNVYTVAQALQLYQHAYGIKRPSPEGWLNDAGKLVDPLRPGATSAGFDNEAALLAAREAHYAAVRAMFETASVLVFTLGLTEAWKRNSDKSILPLAPGVSAGEYLPSEYSFVNFTYEQVRSDLVEFLACVARTNPSLKVILTISPIPLAATFVPRHVAVSTMASKAVLRAAVEAIIPSSNAVEYFPSFEIFYTPGIGGSYFETDHRHVGSAGVSHAMRVFEAHFIERAVDTKGTNSAVKVSPNYAAFYKAYYDVWCDEDRISDRP